MKQKYHLEFITPCFCSGADQGKAEIRASSIRGELRWWFRALGGMPEDEALIFGGVSGKARKSNLCLRVSQQNIISTPSSLPRIGGIDPVSYLLHFAKASGDGKRIKAEGFIGPGSTFDLDIVVKGTCPAMLQNSLDAFLLLGSIGLRATRASGAFVEQGAPLSFEEFRQKTSALTRQRFDVVHVCDDRGNPDFLPVEAWKTCYYQLGMLLKEGYRSNRDSGKKIYSAGKNGSNPTPLGSANPRQKSGLRLRPILLKEGLLSVAFFSDVFLGDVSTTPSFDLMESKSRECDIELCRL